jgi:hypothetical protein
MAVQSDTSRIQYAGNNSTTTSYTVPFVFQENSHLKAIARTSAGVESVVTLTNHTGAGDVNGGTVRTAVAVPATSTLTIYREVPATQTTTYAEGGDFPAASHERALDKLTQIAQQLDRKVGSAIRLSAATQLPDLNPPLTNQQHILSSVGGAAPSWQALPSLSIGPVIATGSTTARSVQDRFADTVNVKDYGAVGDGVADDTAAIQAAIDAASAGSGGTVKVPAGTYKITATLNMKPNVTVACDDGAVINGESFSGTLVTFNGTVGSEFDFSAARTRGDTTVALSGSPTFAVGDIIHLVSYSSVFAAGEYKLGNHPTDNCYYTEWNIVAADLGSGSYRLAVPFEFPDWTTSAKAKKVTPCANAHWIGGKILRTTQTGTIFRSDWAYQCSVSDVSVYHGTTAGGTVSWWEAWRCEGRRVINHNDPTFLFNYDLHHADFNRFLTVGSQDCGFVEIEDSWSAQSVDFTYSNASAPFSNVRSYCRGGRFYRCFEGLTSHQGCYQEQWIGNTITDCYDDGFVIRGYMPTLFGNIITSTLDEVSSDTLRATAGSFIVGRQYTIASVGTTNFTLIGAASNTNGVRFVATGVGSGTGTADGVKTVGIRLSYGGPRRADIANNKIVGFWSAFDIYGSSTLGRWTNILCNIHDNEVSHCFNGLTTSGIGNTNDYRFLTYKNNRHSVMGRFVVRLEEYCAGASIIGNVMDGAFRYSGAGSFVGFVVTDTNCPSLHVHGNRWNRTQGSNSGKSKYFVFAGSISDTTTFPKANWAAQTYVDSNVASFDTDADFIYASITETNYVQYATLLPYSYTSTISSGAAEIISTPSRVSYIQVDTEAAAASDDLDTLVPYTNTYVQEGDVAYLRTTASARDVVIRDATSSGATSNGFQTPSSADVTLGTVNDVVMLLRGPTHWLVASQSLNGV